MTTSLPLTDLPANHISPPPADHPLLADLTDSQRLAATTTEGPLLVLAAAGSGKTRVITRRIAWLIREIGIAPWQVLAITFTNKAASEMRDRVGQVLTERQGKAVTVSTFHSLCARLLREFSDFAKLPPGYSIYDTADQKRAIKEAMSQLEINKKNFSPDALLSAISNAKNELIDEAAYQATASDFFERNASKVYRKYQQILQQNNAVDFDDLLFKVADLLRNNQQVRSELQDRYQYLLIDEYQDTNHAQFVIANLLAAAHRNICVVGDPDQSIYGWRGANIRNILDFEQHFQQAAVVELGENFRSTPQILQAADTLIRNNRMRKHKPLYTENEQGDNIELIQTSDEKHEAELVVDWLKQIHEENHPWSDMAIFYRVNSLSRVIEEYLLKSAVPYQIVRGTAFYQRKEIKDALAYLKLLVNPDDDIALQRIINTPTRGIGNTTIQNMQSFADARHLSLFIAMQDDKCTETLTKRASNAISKFIDMVNQWHNKLKSNDHVSAFTPSVREVIEMIIRDSNLENYYKEGKYADDDKLANLYELVTSAQNFDDEYGEENPSPTQCVADYLQQVSLVADTDDMDNDSGTVTLMTLHAAKGLEFPVVAMIGLEEGLLPHSRSFDNPAELEEERRLCFVGITRAQHKLRLSHARYRTMRGFRERTIPSQFLGELPDEVIDEKNMSGYGDDFDPFSSFDDGFDDAIAIPPTKKPTGLVKDAFVRHPQFGVGTILSVTGAGFNARARIRFNSVGVKTLVLEYARLELVE